MLSLENRVLPLERVAVLTDLKDDLVPTLDYVAALCRWYHSDLILFHATSQKSIEGATQKLNGLLDKRALSDVHTRTIVSKAEINDALDELDVFTPDLLVLTSRPRTGVRKWVAGSVTQQVFRHTRHPVLVFGPQIPIRANLAPQPFSRILYATDMSPVSVMALHFAAGLAHDHQAQLTVLYVESSPEKSFTAHRVVAEQHLREWMKNHIGGMAHAIENARVTIDFGNPATHILSAADANKADLIVMGGQGAGAMVGLAGRVLGGTAYEVCCNSKCPLLIVPEAR